VLSGSTAVATSDVGGVDAVASVGIAADEGAADAADGDAEVCAGVVPHANSEKANTNASKLPLFFSLIFLLNFFI
jgi:hypothetical protein